MENIIFWQNLWFFLILLILGIYTMLDGFDLGIGILMPFFYKDKKDPYTLLSSISPVWDGNEVWLITGVGSLFAVFPAAYVTLLSGFYLPLILTIFFFIFRAVAFGLWYHSSEGKFLWEIVFIVSSILASFLAMLALGNLLAGISLDSQKNITGNLMSFFSPLPLIFSITGLLILSLQGMAYTTLKSKGPLSDKARKFCGFLAPLVLAFLLVFLILYRLIHPSELNKAGIWTGLLISFLSLTAIRVFLKKINGRIIFILSSLVIAGLWVIVGSILYPNLIKSTNPEFSLTIFNASASISTLKLMAYVAIIGLTVVSFYTIFVYRIFKENSGYSGDEESGIEKK